VTGYTWGFTDPPSMVAVPATTGGSVTVTWTPTTAGPKTLSVQAVNGDGLTSELVRYQFTVVAPAPVEGSWVMDEPAGGTTLADETGHGHTAVNRSTVSSWKCVEFLPLWG
jgi:hypothetical protein